MYYAYSENLRVNDSPLDCFPECISNLNFRTITLSEFSPENFTKVTFIGKIAIIYTFSSVPLLIMLLGPLSLFRTRSSNATFGHISHWIINISIK